MSALPAKHLFDLDEWQRLGHTGFFAPGQRAELINGEIIDMSPIGPTHTGCVAWLHNFFSQKLFGQAIVWNQSPIQLGDFSEPEPDLTILRYREDFYRTRHPQVDDVLLLIEVADRTLSYDRNTKAPLYARFGIAEYWIVNLAANSMEVYRQPETTGYAEKTTFKRGEVLHPVNLPGIEIDVGAVLG